MSIKVPVITTETAGRIGAGAAVIGAYSVPFLGELAMSSSVAHGIETVKAPISEIKFLKTGVRPEGIKNDDWDKYKREIDEYNKSQIERQKALRSQKKMALVEIGLSGTILGTRIYRGGKWFLKEPIDKVVMRGKNYAINKYEASTKVYPGGATAKGTIRTYVPPDRAIYTTRARKLFGLKDKIDTIGKGKKFITEYDLISGKVGVAGKYETTKVGSRQTIKGVFGGAAERITPESFAQLPKSQQYIYRKLVEGKLGKPVSLKNVPKMLGKADLSKGSMFQIDRYKVGPQYKYVPKKGVVLDIGSKRYQIYNPKKSIRLYEGVAESEKGVTIGIGKKGGKELIRYKLDEGKVSLDVVGLKKVSPNAKPIARGDITKLEGTTTYEYYDYPGKVFEPTNLGKVKPAPDIYNLAQIGKPTIQTTVPKLTTIQKQSIQGALVTKPIPKISSPKVPTIFATGETGVGLTAQELAPRMVGGLGLGLSQYSKTDLDTTSITRPSLKTLPTTISESRVGYTQKPISPQVTKPVVISTTVQKPVIITSQIIKPLTAQASRQAQVVKPVVAQKSLTTITPPVPVIRPPTPPPTIIGGYYRRPQQPKVSRPIVKPSKPKPTSYAVDVRKKGGVWAQVIKGVTKKEATAIGMLETKKGAIASFRKRVVGGKARKQKIYAPTYLKALFRPSKYEKGVTVEKEGLRITTRKEVKEISYMGGLAVKGKKRKKKGGKKKK